MYREGLITNEEVVDEDTRTAKAGDYVNELIYRKKQDDKIASSGSKPWEVDAKKRASLVIAAKWILKLQSSILMEDWAAMDSLTSLPERPDPIASCPDAIEVFIYLQ